MNPVIVTDVRYRMSLPIIRALGRKKIPVICTERNICPQKAALGFYSKYSSENVLLPDVSENAEEFFSELEALCRKQPARPVIIPVGINTLLALCEKRDMVSEFADVALPPFESIELANDKARLIPFAGEIGVPIPKTEFIREDESVEDFASRTPYPAVIKFPAGEMLGLAPNDRYSIVRSKEEFISVYEKFAAYGGNILVQQYITGDGYGVSAVFDKNSNPIEIFCHHRLREYPSSGGPSSFCESADLPELADYAVKLLRELKWTGVAMVEFKGNPEDGFCLMEINPRFWGSSGLAPNSGCNIPYALYRASQGDEAKPYTSFSPNYKVRHRMRFLLQDLLTFPSYLKKSNRKLSFAASFFFGLLNPRISDGVLDIRDIRSSVRYLLQAFKKTDSIVR